MLVYFARPIDQAGLSPQELSPVDIEGPLAGLGHTVYRPAQAFLVGYSSPPAHAEIDEINQIALAAAGALVAWLPRGVSTLGVPAEIEEALRTNKPTIIITDITDSVQLNSWSARGATVGTWEAIAFELRLILLARPDRAMPKPAAASQTPDLLYSLDNDATAPSRAYSGDAGLDLAISVQMVVPARGYQLISTGIRAAVPEGYYGQMVGRSSTWSRLGLQVQHAVIDSGYRGELMIGVHNPSDQDVKLEAGTRLAQYILLPVFQGKAMQVATLPEHERGENGYGSSGR